MATYCESQEDVVTRTVATTEARRSRRLGTPREESWCAGDGAVCPLEESMGSATGGLGIGKELGEAMFLLRVFTSTGDTGGKSLL